LPAVRFASSDAGSRCPQAIENFPGVRFDKGVRIRLVRGDVDCLGVKIVEVHRSDDLLGDARRESDRDPVAFTMIGIPGALSAKVG
jgi:hypothetical protein